MNNKTGSNGSVAPQILLWAGGVFLILFGVGYFLQDHENRARREILVKQEALLQAQQQEALRQSQQQALRQAQQQEALRQAQQQEKLVMEQQANSLQSTAKEKDITFGLMANLVTEYYNTHSEWAGTFTMENVKRWRLEDIDSDRKRAHVEYRYVAVPGNRQGRMDTGIDQRTFDFVWINGSWQVTNMGGNMSARL